MTNDEIRAVREAAKRLYGCTQAQVAKDIRDVDVLVDTILKLFPDDDEEKITEQWLREEWGFESFWQQAVELHINPYSSLRWSEIAMRFEQPFHGIATRRQFRQLAECLGIKPTTNATKGE